MKTYRSKCCNAGVKATNGGSGMTWWYQCKKCNNPADISTESIDQVVEVNKMIGGFSGGGTGHARSSEVIIDLAALKKPAGDQVTDLEKLIEEAKIDNTLGIQRMFQSSFHSEPPTIHSREFYNASQFIEHIMREAYKAGYEARRSEL